MPDSEDQPFIFGVMVMDPVPVSDRPWEKEAGWLDLDGECWWCPEDGDVCWQMANPTWVYGGWILPSDAIAIPSRVPAA